VKCMPISSEWEYPRNRQSASFASNHMPILVYKGHGYRGVLEEAPISLLALKQRLLSQLPLFSPLQASRA